MSLAMGERSPQNTLTVMYCRVRTAHHLPSPGQQNNGVGQGLSMVSPEFGPGMRPEKRKGVRKGGLFRKKRTPLARGTNGAQERHGRAGEVSWPFPFAAGPNRPRRLGRFREGGRLLVLELVWRWRRADFVCERLNHFY